jgi:hypothetical protein
LRRKFLRDYFEKLYKIDENECQIEPKKREKDMMNSRKPQIFTRNTKVILNPKVRIIFSNSMLLMVTMIIIKRIILLKIMLTVAVILKMKMKMIDAKLKRA